MKSLKAVYLSSESYIDHSYTIVKGLREKSNELELTVFFQAKELTEEVSRWCESTGSNFVKRRRFRNPLSFFDDLDLLRKVKKQKADIVWFNTMTVYQAILAPIMLKKYIVMMHDVEFHPGSTEKHGTLAAKLTLRFSKNKIATASKEQAKLFKKQYGTEPKVFQLPVITYFKDSAAKGHTEKNSGLTKFFFFGSIEKYKGIETLLDAVEILEGKGLEFEVNIHGKIKYDREILSERISKLRSVNLHDKFIDYRDIHSVYANSDVKILPYRQVTQCGPLLIGFSEVVPSICNYLPGFREYVTDSVDGIFFDGTAVGLAEKMEAIENNKSIVEKLKQGIDNNALKNFSMNNLADRYIENLKETADLN